MGKIIEDQSYFYALGYKSLTNVYDQLMRLLMPKRFRPILVEFLNPQENELILDFGTGTAEIAIKTAKSCPSCIIEGIDTDPRILKIADNKIKRFSNKITTRIYDGESLPYSDNYFDKAVTCLVFCNLTIKNKEKYIREIYRVLKPGGTLFICDLGYEKKVLKRKLFNFIRSLTPLRPLIIKHQREFYQLLENSEFKNMECFQTLKTFTGTLYYYAAEKQKAS